MGRAAHGLSTSTLAAALGSPDFSLAVSPSTERRLVWALPVVLAISVYYVFLASAGTFRDLPQQLDYYDRMCEGFRHGHLYILQAPSPELLEKADPFAYSNVNLWLWDASLYKGHYYMYWGPVPGLLLLAFKVLTGSHERITDQWPTALFMVGRLIAGAGIVLSLASRVWTRQPAWICALAIAVFGLANPSPFVVARPHVYEASLAGGQCFLFLGLFWAFSGLTTRASRRLFFLLSSLSWALAAGCRVTAFLPVPLLIAATAGFAWHLSSRSPKRFAYDCLALGAPFAVAACAYGAYNYARFESVIEFGQNYQVTRQPFTGNSAYVVPNLFSYFFAPVRWSCRFPFVNILDHRPLSSLIEWPLGYESFERVGGILITDAWCWLVLLWIWRIAEYLWGRRRGDARSSSNIEVDELWLFICSMATVVSIVPALPLWEASMRYVEDAVGGLVLASTLGVFWLLQRTYFYRRRAFGLFARGVILAFGAQTCVVGALAAVTSYEDPLKTKNPVLFEQLEEWFSLCRESR